MNAIGFKDFENAIELFWDPSIPEIAIRKKQPVTLSVDGKKLTLKEWSKKTGLAVCTIRQRLNSGATEKESVAPHHPKYRPKKIHADVKPTAYQLARIARFSTGQEFSLIEFKKAIKCSSESRAIMLMDWFIYRSEIISIEPEFPTVDPAPRMYTETRHGRRVWTNSWWKNNFGKSDKRELQ